MAFNCNSLTQSHFENLQSWNNRDTIIYALATGYGQEGVDDQNLQYFYERDLVVVPSFATILARNAAPSVADLGGNYSKSVLASVRADYHSPLPSSGSVTATTSITGVLDKGSAKGALVGLETKLHDDNQCYATISTSLMARADGGCGSFGKISPSFSIPDREADQTKKLFTRPDQAALYRLLGDKNPLHIDPQAATNSGFNQPILHGLCTYGIAYRGLREIFSQSLNSVSARFSAPVYPGETLRIKVWSEGKHAHFELHSEDRNLCVLSSGYVYFSDEAPT